jgi:hypothetical protein
MARAGRGSGPTESTAGRAERQPPTPAPRR